MNKIKIGLVLLAAVVLTACGQRVTVSPNEVGKILSPSGYKEQIIPTSTFRLDSCFLPGSICDKLVTLNAADSEVKEQITLFMPQDKLQMSFDVRMVLAVDPSQYDLLFNKIPASKSENNGYYIPLSKVYSVYAEQIIRTISREIMSEYSIADVVSNREVIGAQLAEELTKQVRAKTPFIVRYAGLADVNYPDIITKAQEKAAERREQIAEEEAKTQKRMIELERELVEAQKQRKVDVEKAEAEAAVNKILANSITPAYITYKQLESLDKVATSANTKFIPFEMLSSMGAQVMMGNQK